MFLVSLASEGVGDDNPINQSLGLLLNKPDKKCDDLTAPQILEQINIRYPGRDHFQLLPRILFCIVRLHSHRRLGLVRIIVAIPSVTADPFTIMRGRL